MFTLFQPCLSKPYLYPDADPIEQNEAFCFVSIWYYSHHSIG